MRNSIEGINLLFLKHIKDTGQTFYWNIIFGQTDQIEEIKKIIFPYQFELRGAEKNFQLIRIFSQSLKDYHWHWQERSKIKVKLTNTAILCSCASCFSKKPEDIIKACPEITHNMQIKFMYMSIIIQPIITAYKPLLTKKKKEKHARKTVA